MQAMTRIVTVLAILLTVGTAQATITIDTVTVGDAGNAADTRYDSGGYGSVSYAYNIGKYEVTAGQYTAFLNAVGGVDTYGLYNTSMWSGIAGCKIQQSGGGIGGNLYTYSVTTAYANRPVNYVSFWDSCRFANWLTNGQPIGAQVAGTTETGTYALNGYNGADGRTILRVLSTTGATWAVTSEDEWYKAAYYKGGSTNAGYWDFPTCSDSISGAEANYLDSLIGHTTDAGSYSYPSPYGTFDQGGNVWEWNEAIPDQGSGYAHRGLRGGSYNFSIGSLAASEGRIDGDPRAEVEYVGFRVSEVPVPEPLTMVAVGMGIAGLGGYIRRRRMASK